MTELLDVRLLGLPVDVHVRAATHMDALNREFELIRRTASDHQSTPYRLQALIDRLGAEFGGVGDAPGEELQAAIDRGDTTVDLVFQVPPAVADACQQLGDMLDEVDDYCRAGDHLLSLVTPAESLDYRRWYLGEFLRQVADEPPAPWPTRVDWTPATTAAGREVVEAIEDGAASPLPEGWSREHTEGATIVRVAGPLDLESAPALRSLALELLQPDLPLVIDLADASFVDSVGLSVLIAVHLRAADDDGAVHFILGPTAQTVIEAAGLAEVLAVVPATGT